MMLTQAAVVMKAATKAQKAQRRVADARRALAMAEKARDRAESRYLKLVSDALTRTEPLPQQTSG